MKVTYDMFLLSLYWDYEGSNKTIKRIYIWLFRWRADPWICQKVPWRRSQLWSCLPLVTRLIDFTRQENPLQSGCCCLIFNDVYFHIEYIDFDNAIQVIMINNKFHTNSDHATLLQLNRECCKACYYEKKIPYYTIVHKQSLDQCSTNPTSPKDWVIQNNKFQPSFSVHFILLLKYYLSLLNYSTAVICFHLHVRTVA